MSTDIVAGGSSAEMSAAERLMAKHEAQAKEQESHNVTVEEVPDEDLLAHPPPAATGLTSLPISTDPSRVATPSGEAGSFSAKAAGKQPVREAPPAAAKPALDTKSEELFPALGPSKTPAAALPSMWSKKPAAVGKAHAGSNGVVNGTGNTANAASRASTPASGMVTPNTTAASQRGPTPQMTLPGRNSEKVSDRLSHGLGPEFDQL